MCAASGRSPSSHGTAGRPLPLLQHHQPREHGRPLRALEEDHGLPPGRRLRHDARRVLPADQPRGGGPRSSQPQPQQHHTGRVHLRSGGVRRTPLPTSPGSHCHDLLTLQRLTLLFLTRPDTVSPPVAARRSPSPTRSSLPSASRVPATVCASSRTSTSFLTAAMPLTSSAICSTKYMLDFLHKLTDSMLKLVGFRCENGSTKVVDATKLCCERTANRIDLSPPRLDLKFCLYLSLTKNSYSRLSRLYL